MSCVNPNSPEFKKILEIEPNFLLAEILYDKMMKEQSYKIYDDIFDLKDMLGHTNVKQTEAYINSINTIQISQKNTERVSSLLDDLI